MELRISTSGTDRVIRRLRKMSPRHNPAILKEPTEKGSKLLRDEFRIYGPPLPNQKYVRTYRLRSGWRMRVLPVPGGYRGYIFNRVRYAPLVQRHGDQADIHDGRWRTDVDIIYDNRAEIVGYYEEALRKAARQ